MLNLKKMPTYISQQVPPISIFYTLIFRPQPYFLLLLLLYFQVVSLTLMLTNQKCALLATGGSQYIVMTQILSLFSKDLIFSLLNLLILFLQKIVITHLKTLQKQYNGILSSQYIQIAKPNLTFINVIKTNGIITTSQIIILIKKVQWVSSFMLYHLSQRFDSISIKINKSLYICLLNLTELILFMQNSTVPKKIVPYHFKSIYRTIQELQNEDQYLSSDVLSLLFEYIFNYPHPSKFTFYTSGSASIEDQKSIKFPILVEILTDPTNNVCSIKQIKHKNDLRNIETIPALIKSNQKMSIKLLYIFLAKNSLLQDNQKNNQILQVLKDFSEKDLRIQLQLKIKHAYLEYYQYLFQQIEKIKNDESKHEQIVRQFMLELQKQKQVKDLYQKHKDHIEKIKNKQSSKTIQINPKHPASIVVQSQAFFDSVINSQQYQLAWEKKSIREAKQSSNWKTWIQHYKNQTLQKHKQWTQLSQQSRNILIIRNQQQYQQLLNDEKFANDQQWKKIYDLKRLSEEKSQFRNQIKSTAIFKKAEQIINSLTPSQRKFDSFKKFEKDLVEKMNSNTSFAKQINYFREFIRLLCDVYFRQQQIEYNQYVHDLCQILKCSEDKFKQYVNDTKSIKQQQIIDKNMVNQEKIELQVSIKERIEQLQIDRVLDAVYLSFESNQQKASMTKLIKQRIFHIQSLTFDYESVFQNDDNEIQPIKMIEWGKKYIRQQIKRQNKFYRQNHLGNTWSVDLENKYIAFMDRVYELLFRKRLRVTQLVSIILFLTNKSGHISQINTGEGKSTIIAFVAACKGLKGMINDQKVDVITSNTVLAANDASYFKQFFEMFELTVSHNNEISFEGPKSCYLSHIVYGTICNFQFDYLRDSLDNSGVLNGRQISKNWAILDEIDSLVLDRGGNIAKISEKFPGMDGLKVTYLKIWNEFLKQKKLLLEKIDNEGNNQKQVLEILMKSEEQLFRSICQHKQQILVKDFLLQHLKLYAELQFQKWVRNCLYAYFKLTQNVHYRIITKNNSSSILLIDNQETGQSLHNTIMSNGIHQFLQIKHGLRLSNETLTGSFISNLGYIRKYSSKVIGLTGTLGSRAEEQMFKELYRVSISKIPPFKQKIVQNQGGIVFQQHRHILQVVRSALCEVRKKHSQIKYNNSLITGQKWMNEFIPEDSNLPNQKNQCHRSVLIIFKSIANVMEAKRILAHQLQLLGLKQSDITLKLYTEQKESDIANQIVQPKTIILATTISARGTDFQISPQLNKYGGLHVIIAFLPRNQRIQDQGSGRTGRKGQCGSFKNIISTFQIGLSIDKDYNQIIKYRDKLEKIRINQQLKPKVKQLQFDDQIYQKFCQFYQKKKEQISQDNPLRIAVVTDLKQRWAFWFYKQQFNKIIDHPKQKFTLFENQIQNSQIDIQIVQKLFNPCNIIKTIEILLQKSDFAKAEQLLRPLLYNQNNSQILAFIYLRLIEIYIASQSPVFNRLMKALKDITFLSLFQNMIRQTKSQLIFQELLSKLNDAMLILHRQKLFLQQLFGIQYNKEGKIIKRLTPQLQFIQNNSQLAGGFFTRLSCLSMFYFHIIQMRKVASQSLQDKENQVCLKISNTQFLRDLKTQATQNNNNWITNVDVNEFEMFGLNTHYQMSKLHDIPTKVIQTSQIMIASGLAAYALSFPYPLLAPFWIQFGTGLIFEAISDLITWILDWGATQFNAQEFSTKKLWLVFKTILTSAFALIMTWQKFIDKIIKYIAKLKTKFCNNKIATYILQSLEKYLFKLQSKLTNKQVYLKLQSNNQKLTALTTMKSKSLSTFFTRQIACQSQKIMIETFKSSIATSVANKLKDQLISISGLKIVKVLFKQQIYKPLNTKLFQDLSQNMEAFQKCDQLSQDQMCLIVNKIIQKISKQSVFASAFASLINNITQFDDYIIKISKGCFKKWVIHLVPIILNIINSGVHTYLLISKSVTLFNEISKQYGQHGLNVIFVPFRKNREYFVKKLAQQLTQIMLSAISSLLVDVGKSSLSVYQLYEKQEQFIQPKEQCPAPLEQVLQIQNSYENKDQAYQGLGMFLQMDPNDLKEANLNLSNKGYLVNDIKYLFQDYDINVLQHSKDTFNYQTYKQNILPDQKENGLIIIRHKQLNQNQIFPICSFSNKIYSQVKNKNINQDQFFSQFIKTINQNQNFELSFLTIDIQSKQNLKRVKTAIHQEIIHNSGKQKYQQLKLRQQQKQIDD